MKYHYTRKNDAMSHYGENYICNHPVYNECTLFKIRDRGLAVIQQRFDPVTKATYWGPIDDDLTDVLYLHPAFKPYFDIHAAECENELYPTVCLRQLMWALRMKPLSREPWETYFDRKDI